MPEKSVQHGKTFDENIETLFDEIVLAEQWGRPSLLLAVHKSKVGLDKAEKALETRLVEKGFEVAKIVFNDQRSDISQLIAEAGPKSRPVYFISNIDWGGGEDGRQAYRGLNLHRELFVEESVKAVFWLTVNEAANLPRFAPDFWAFRHRTVEFISQRAAGKVQLPAGILAWDMMQQPFEAFERPEEGIAAREELLRRLPDTLESLAARVELRAGLGQLRWNMGNLDGAAAEFQAGMETAAEYELPELKAGLHNGMGIIRYEGGEYAAALDQFNEGLRFRSLSRALLSNLSAANCMLGRIQEALAAGKKALRAGAEDPETWRRIGYIYNATGRLDEAISCMAKAAELAPRSPEPRIALAVLYGLVDRPDDARAQMQRADELAEGRPTGTHQFVRESFFGRAKGAHERLAEAIAAGRLTPHGAQRDVNVQLLLDQDQTAGITE